MAITVSSSDVELVFVSVFVVVVVLLSELVEQELFIAMLDKNDKLPKTSIVVRKQWHL